MQLPCSNVAPGNSSMKMTNIAITDNRGPDTLPAKTIIENYHIKYLMSVTFIELFIALLLLFIVLLQLPIQYTVAISHDIILFGMHAE